MSQPRVLVTGATGFIGRNLLPLLSQRGFAVRGQGRGRERPATHGDGPEWIEIANIGPRTDWTAALDGIDAVVHLAGLAHVADADLRNPEADFARVNVLGTARLAEAAEQAGIRRLVMVSSVAVFGRYRGEPFTEATTCAPDSAYGHSKLEGERALQRALAGCATDWCILRPPLVYGPGNPGNMARLLRALDAGMPIPLGRTVGRRSYVYVGNLTDLLVRCIDDPRASRRVFVVDDGEPVGTLALVRDLCRLTGRPERIWAVPLGLLRFLGLVGDLVGRVARRSVPFNSATAEKLLGSMIVDSRLVRSTLHWAPPVSPTEGWRRTIESSGVGGAAGTSPVLPS